MNLHQVRAGLAAATLLAMLAACQKDTPPAPAASASASPTAPVVTAAEPGCPDDGPRFPITHLCVGRSINYIDPNLRLIAEAPKDCSWGMVETAFPLPDGEGALLYRALTCKGLTTKLEFSAGAHMAELRYAVSALYTGPEAKGHVVVRIFDGGGEDPKKQILAQKAAIKDAAERDSCEVLPADDKAWPADALLLKPNAAAWAKLQNGDPVWACGPYGVDEDAQVFWRVAQGYAWYFTMGQDTMDVDPASLLIFKKGVDGAWAPLP